MIISDLIGSLEALATLIGLPFFSVLVGFFILSIELLVLGIFMLFTVLRIRKEMIVMNRKINLLARPFEKGAEIEFSKEPKNELKKESSQESEREPEKGPKNELKKKKYRYKWK